MKEKRGKSGEKKRKRVWRSDMKTVLGTPSDVEGHEFDDEEPINAPEVRQFKLRSHPHEEPALLVTLQSKYKGEG